VIRSFADLATTNLFNGGDSRRDRQACPSTLWSVVARKLTQLQVQYVTFVVPHVDELYEKARAMGATLVQEPRNEFYGQRRFLVLDPAGCLVDICSPWSDEEA